MIIENGRRKNGLVFDIFMFYFALLIASKQTEVEKSWKMFTKHRLTCWSFFPKDLIFPQISNKSYDVIVIIAVLNMFCVSALRCCYISCRIWVLFIFRVLFFFWNAPLMILIGILIGLLLQFCVMKNVQISGSPSLILHSA